MSITKDQIIEAVAAMSVMDVVEPVSYTHLHHQVRWGSRAAKGSRL